MIIMHLLKSRPQKARCITLLLPVVAPVMLFVMACTPTQVVRLEPGKTPSEFATTTRSSLELPPEINLQRPGNAQSARLQDTPQDKAQATIFGKTTNIFEGQGLSKGERALLLMLGAETAQPNIVEILEEEATQLRIVSPETLSKFFGIKPDELGTVVHPGKETRRIAQAKALGKPLSGSDSPYLLARRKAWLEP